MHVDPEEDWLLDVTFKRGLLSVSLSLSPSLLPSPPLSLSLPTPLEKPIIKRLKQSERKGRGVSE